MYDFSLGNKESSKLPRGFDFHVKVQHVQKQMLHFRISSTPFAAKISELRCENAILISLLNW